MLAGSRKPPPISNTYAKVIIAVSACSRLGEVQENRVGIIGWVGWRQ